MTAKLRTLAMVLGRKGNPSSDPSGYHLELMDHHNLFALFRGITSKGIVCVEPIGLSQFPGVIENKLLL